MCEKVVSGVIGIGNVLGIGASGNRVRKRGSGKGCEFRKRVF